MIPSGLGVVLLLAGSLVSAPDSSPDPPRDVHLDGQSPAVVEVDLAAGEYLHVEVRALGTDLTLELVDPAGSTVWGSDDRHTTEGLEALWFVAPAAGTFSLRIACRWSEPGVARIERLERRPATAEDRRRVRAELDFQEGKRERRQPGGDLEAALARLRAARRAFEELGLPSRAAQSVTQEAIVLDKLDRVGEAETLLEATIGAARRRGDAVAEARALNSLAVRAYGRGDLRRAVELEEEAQAAATLGGDPLIAAQVQVNLGLYYAFVGEHRKAATHYRRGAEEAHRIGHVDGEASAWFNASLAHRGLRDYGAYFEDLRRADPLLAKLGQRVDQGRLRINEGIAYYDLGEPERAAERYRQALEVLPEGEVVERARAQLDLGQVDLQLGEPGAARPRVEGCLAALRGRGEPKLRGAALGVLSEIDLAQDRLSVALAHARESVEIARSSGVGRILPDSLVTLAAASRRSGDGSGAESALREALAVGRRQEDPKIEVSARLGLARLHRDQGDLEAALFEAETGIGAVEELRAQIPTLQLQATLLAQYRALFDLAIGLRYDLERAEPGAGHAEAAFSLAERARARSLLDALPALAWRSDATSERLRDLGADLVSARERRASLAGDPGSTGSELEEADRELDHALVAYETARTAWIADHPHERARLDRAPATVTQVQAALGPRGMLLEYHAGEERTFLFLLTRERFEVVDLGLSSELERDVEAFLPHLVHPTVRGAESYRDAAWTLYRWVLPAAEVGSLAGRRVLLAPDGPLVGVPLEALVTTREGRRFEELDYLGRTASMTYLPSAAVGLELRARGRRGDAPGVELVALADPSPGVAPRPGFPPLPGARQEVTSLARLIWPTSTWFGAEAREARVRELTGSPPRYLHFATHAVIDERRPELSAILLTPDPPDDGRLEGWEIATLGLPVDQVVLSACGSALGRPVPGEGLVGLVQAFFEGGARTVVASLWPVVDRGTRRLMVDFYRDLEEDGPAVALARARRAQIARGGLSAHPYYWAPFVLFGWDPPASRTESR